MTYHFIIYGGKKPNNRLRIFLLMFQNLKMYNVQEKDLEDLVKKLGGYKWNRAKLFFSMFVKHVGMEKEKKILMEWCISFLHWFLHQVAPNQEWYLPLTSSILMLPTPKSKRPKASWERPKNLKQSLIGKKTTTKKRMMIDVSLLHADDAFTWNWSTL